jgi:hypothetical protein
MFALGLTGVGLKDEQPQLRSGEATQRLSQATDQ